MSACLNFHGLAPASLSNQPLPAKSAIFGKIGRKTINLAGFFLPNGVGIYDFLLPRFSSSADHKNTFVLKLLSFPKYGAMFAHWRRH